MYCFCFLLRNEMRQMNWTNGWNIKFYCCSDRPFYMFCLFAAEHGAQHAVVEPEWASGGSRDHRDAAVPGAGAAGTDALSNGRETAIPHLQRLVHGPPLTPNDVYLKVPIILLLVCCPVPLHIVWDRTAVNVKHDKEFTRLCCPHSDFNHTYKWENIFQALDLHYCSLPH